MQFLSIREFYKFPLHKNLIYNPDDISAQKIVPNTNSAYYLGTLFTLRTHHLRIFAHFTWSDLTDKITAHCQVRQQRREALRVCGREDCPATDSQTGVGSGADQVDSHVQGRRPHSSSLWPLVQPDLLPLPHQAARLHAQAVSQSAFRQSLSPLLARAIHRVEQVISLRTWVIRFPCSSHPYHSFIPFSFLCCNISNPLFSEYYLDFCMRNSTSFIFTAYNDTPIFDNLTFALVG